MNSLNPFLKLISSNIKTYSKVSLYKIPLVHQFWKLVDLTLTLSWYLDNNLCESFFKLNKTTSQISLIMNFTFFYNCNHHFMQNSKFRMLFRHHILILKTYLGHFGIPVGVQRLMIKVKRKLPATKCRQECFKSTFLVRLVVVRWTKCRFITVKL